MLVMCNIDNLIADQVPYLIDKLMEIGTRNVHVVPAFTKKGRQEYIFFIDLAEENLNKVSKFMASEAGTIGLRILNDEHISFDYEMRSVELNISDRGSKWSGQVNVKLIKDKDGGFLSARAEFEELKSTLKALEKSGLVFTFYELKSLVEAKVIRDIRKEDISLDP